jgi:hypothetical protein
LLAKKPLPTGDAKFPIEGLHMHTKTTLMLIVAFSLGCAATRAFIVPPAHAQNVQRWEYLCIEEHGAEDIMAKANQAGDQGWEMVGGDGVSSVTSWCFKRAK